MDFRRVSRLFADPEWDGEIEQDDDYNPNPQPETPSEPQPEGECEGDFGNGSDDEGSPNGRKEIQFVGKGSVTVQVLQRLVSILSQPKFSSRIHLQSLGNLLGLQPCLGEMISIGPLFVNWRMNYIK